MPEPKTKEEQIRPMTPGEALLMAMDKAGDPRSTFWDRLAVAPTVGITRAPRMLTAVQKSRLEQLYKVPLKGGKRPKIVEDEIAELLRIPTREEVLLMLKRTGIFGY